MFSAFFTFGLAADVFLCFFLVTHKQGVQDSNLVSRGGTGNMNFFYCKTRMVSCVFSWQLQGRPMCGVA